MESAKESLGRRLNIIHTTFTRDSGEKKELPGPMVMWNERVTSRMGALWVGNQNHQIHFLENYLGMGQVQCIKFPLLPQQKAKDLISVGRMVRLHFSV
jgi:hypothetical protein